MATVNDILTYVESIAPPYMMESWDNVGLLCGRKDRAVRKTLVALDPFRNVIEEAIREKADLIVTHHPLIFGDALMAVNEDSETGRCLLALMEHGIAAINAHTNLDIAPGGVNDVLAEALGLADIEVVAPNGTDAMGRPYGLLHGGSVEEMPLADFLDRVKSALGTPVLRYADGGRPVRRVCVGGGSCGGALQEAAANGYDTFVTADVKYNQFWDARDLGLTIIDAGHFYTENPAVRVLAAKLRAAFPEVEVVFSEKHHDVMKFF